MIHQFTVSEARTAITCPRIFYFDEQRFRCARPKTKRVTQIWTGLAGAVSGCGKLFHDTVERFNKLALTAIQVREALDKAAKLGDAKSGCEQICRDLKRFIITKCLNRALLNSKQPPEQQAFGRALDQYVGELADLLGYGLVKGRTAPDLLQEFFGDTRKRVDVTFHVGPNGYSVRVRGILDYIYFDFRRNSNRIVDFKLLPAEAVSKDLLQASLYALMHDQQHRSSPDAAVMYLHPERKVVEVQWAQLGAERGKVFDLLASMSAWSDYDEAKGQGLKPPGEPALCRVCPWNRNNQCEKRLGPKGEGDRVRQWTLAAKANEPGPEIASTDPPEPPPEIEYDEEAEFQPSNQDTESTKSGDAMDDAAIEEGPVAGLRLGKTVPGGRPVVMPLAALNTHVSIMGAAGSGKSWLAKVVVEEAICQGVPVLAIDPQGDLVQFLRPALLSADAAVTDRQGQAAFNNCAEVRIWTPGTSHGQRLCLSPMRLPKQADLQGFETPQRRQEEWETMLGIAAGNLVQLAQAGGDTEVQKTFVLEILRKLVQHEGQEKPLGLEQILAALAAPDTLGLDDLEQMISKRDREKLKQRLFARARGPSANLFAGGTPLDIDRMMRPIDEGKTPLNVIYLNALPGDGQKQYFVAALAAEVYRWMITSVSSGSVRLLCFLDEARDFLPAGASKPPAKEPLLRLFSQGRKFGVSCLICTQSPRSVDYQAFSNASTKLIGRLEASQDVQRVSDWFREGDGPPSWLPGRNGAEKGNMIGRWPEMPAELEGQGFRSRPLYSLHEGAWSPDRVELEWSRSSLAARLAAELCGQ